MQGLTDAGWQDVLRARYPDIDRVFSWWDYRRGDFHEGRGMRIDLVLATAALAERVEWCVIDRNARKGQLPSDHAPVIVDFAGRMKAAPSFELDAPAFGRTEASPLVDRQARIDQQLGGSGRSLCPPNPPPACGHRPT